MSLRLQWRRYRRRLAKPLRNARGVFEEREGFVVRILGPDGSAGYGEACPLPGMGGESLETIEACLRSLGEQPSIEAISGVDAALPCTRFAVECALVELRGLRLLPPVRERRLPVAALCDLWTPFEQGVLPAVERGHTTLKFKIGLERPGRELARIETLLGTLPSGVSLRLDANAGLTREEAEAYLVEAARWPVEFVEQPLAAEDHAGLVDLATRHPGRVAVEESVTRPRDLALLARAGWTGPVVVKPSLLGTVVLWADAWTRYSWPWIFSSALETAVGAGHALGIAFSLSREPRAVGFGTGSVLPDDGLGGSWPKAWIEWLDIAEFAGDEVWRQLEG